MVQVKYFVAILIGERNAQIKIFIPEIVSDTAKEFR